MERKRDLRPCFRGLLLEGLGLVIPIAKSLHHVTCDEYKELDFFFVGCGLSPDFYHIGESHKVVLDLQGGDLRLCHADRMPQVLRSAKLPSTRPT